MFYVTKTKECKEKKKCPFLFENSRTLSPPWGPQAPFSSSEASDFLSTYPEIDSFSNFDLNN